MNSDRSELPVPESYLFPVAKFRCAVLRPEFLVGLVAALHFGINGFIGVELEFKWEATLGVERRIDAHVVRILLYIHVFARLCATERQPYQHSL